MNSGLGRLDARYIPKEGVVDLADGVTSFALAGYLHYRTNNTSLVSLSSITGGRYGMELRLHFGDVLTTVVHNVNEIILQGYADLELVPQYSTLFLWHDNIRWVQTGLWII